MMLGPQSPASILQPSELTTLSRAAQRGEGTVGKLLTDEALYSNVNQLSSEGVKFNVRLSPKSEEIPDHQVSIVLKPDQGFLA